MKFSVVIPTCNRLDTLARCLSALPCDTFEIIVSDDGSGDAAQAHIEKRFPTIHWICGPKRGPAANRNHGARAATGEWLAFVDDDCVPQPGWLAALAEACEEADVVEGRTLAPGAADSPFEEHVENVCGGSLWSCNLAVRSTVFAQLGGFDEDFTEAGGEDMEFAWRVKRGGFRVAFAPRALVHHPPRRIGWRGLWRRTWMIRWMSLYRVKTAQPRSLPAAARDEIVRLLRITAQLVTRRNPKQWRRQSFTVAWRWVTFPLTLPYILFWDWRFRQRGQRHSTSTEFSEP